MKNLTRIILVGAFAVVSFPAFSAPQPFPGPSNPPLSSRIHDLRGWCENIAMELKQQLVRTARTGADNNWKAQRLISEAHRILGQVSPGGEALTPHTIDALHSGMLFVDAVKTASASQVGVPQRTKDRVVYRSVVSVYELAIKAFDDLDRPYFFAYADRCSWRRGCSYDYQHEAYFDGLRELSMKMLDLYSRNSEAMANDFIEIQAAKSSVASAKYFLNASEFRRRFACEINELADLESMAAGWSYNDPEYANPGAVYILREGVRNVRNRISHRGCGRHRHGRY